MGGRGGGDSAGAVRGQYEEWEEALVKAEGICWAQEEQEFQGMLDVGLFLSC